MCTGTRWSGFGRRLETIHKWLPILLFVLLILTFVTTYGIAVGLGHIEPWFPYISDTGTMPPESCIFGQFVNIGALICLLIVYIRYLQIKEHVKHPDWPGKPCLVRMNRVTLIVGIAVNLGVSMVGNFQETSIGVVHWTGAALAFVGGLPYFILQTAMTFKTPDVPWNSKCLKGTRVTLCVLDSILLFLLLVPSFVASDKGDGHVTNRLKWTSALPGYDERVLAAVSEWLIALVTVTFFATFYPEFKHFRFRYPKVYYDSNVQRDITEQEQHLSVT